jgi:hypothetical protein
MFASFITIKLFLPLTLFVLSGAHPNIICSFKSGGEREGAERPGAGGRNGPNNVCTYE